MITLIEREAEITQYDLHICMCVSVVKFIYVFSRNMPPSQCSCTLHAQLTEHIPQAQVHVSKISSRRVCKAHIDILIAEGHLSHRCTYICNICGQHGGTLISSKKIKASTSTDSTTDTEINDLVSKISQGYYSQQQLAHIAQALGQTQNQSLYTESLQIGQLYKNTLAQDTTSALLQQSNAVVKSFIEGACTLPSTDTSPHDTRQQSYALALENMYHARNRSFIGPTSFKAHILAYFHSKSKSTSHILGQFGPFGSYTALHKWLNEQGKVPLPTPNTDIISFFDNNQVVGKTHHVSLNSTVKSSTITTIIHIHARNTSTLQHQPHLSPSLWLPHFNLEQSHHAQFEELQKHSEETLRYICFTCLFCHSLISGCNFHTNCKMYLQLRH